MDRNWLSKQNLLGQEIVSAFANNGDFILNVIENMIGGAVLSDLRGKGIFETFCQNIRIREES